MSDDLDNLLRHALKTLDDQVPSGYFEGLPKRTLARLEDGSMKGTSQQGSSGSDEADATGVPPQERDEDSGLHDIRSMATSTKMRLSSRREAVAPPSDDELVSSSAGWKAVALPEPARMVSLPELAESGKHVKVERVTPRRAAAAVEAPPAGASSAPETLDPIAAPAFGAGLAQRKQKSKAGLFAALGLGVAAAAGAAFYVFEVNKREDAAPAVASSEPVTPAPREEVAAVAQAAGSAAPAAPVETTAPEPPVEPAVAASGALDKSDPDPKQGKGDARKSKAAKEPAKDVEEPKQVATKTEVEAQVKKSDPIKKPDPNGKKKEEGNEPSFDDLLKEAGVQDKKIEKPKLDKTSLSSADIKTGMSSVAGKAQACFDGTQGTAQVKLTVDPSGKVQKVSVSGAFAGTPVASCVEGAVKSASFPPWDGGPQSFGYSYLLSE